MPRNKVEKFSISMPEDLASHISQQEGVSGKQGVSKYIQSLVREDRRRKTKAQTRAEKSVTLERGLKDMSAGRRSDLDLGTIETIVRETIERITMGNGNQGNT